MNKAIKLKGYRRVLMLALLLPAALEAATVVTVKVTVVEATCVINGGQAIEVDFGDIAANLGNSDTESLSARFSRTLSYAITCPSNATSKNLKLQLQGTAARGSNVKSSNVLKTNREGLGIALRASGSALNLGDWINFSYPTLPTLTVTPIKTDTSTGVSGGEFTASATMRVEYQ